MADITMFWRINGGYTLDLSDKWLILTKNPQNVEIGHVVIGRFFSKKHLLASK